MKKNKYVLLDSGDFEKLEMLGDYKIIRPSLNSPYKKTNRKLWENPDAIYTKNERGSGEWEFLNKLPSSFFLDLDANIKAKVKLTPFGHIGLFPEQKNNWNLLLKIQELADFELEVLNLFAYSGISTLYAAKAGMKVCHVDASKGMVDWARENAEESGLSNAKVRWIVDDVSKFIKREIKRNHKYNGFILDPPSFGRGAKGEIWKIEEDLLPLMKDLMDLCNGKPDFVILSCHTTGFSPMILERMLSSFINSKTGFYNSKELYIQESAGMKLSGGFCAFYFSEKLADLYSDVILNP